MHNVEIIGATNAHILQRRDNTDPYQNNPTDFEKEHLKMLNDYNAYRKDLDSFYFTKESFREYQ